AIVDLAQVPSGVVGKLEENGSGKRVQRPQMTAKGVKDVELLSILRRDDDLRDRGRLRGEARMEVQGAALVHVRDVDCAVGSRRDAEQCVKQGLPRHA